jgi:hypothetical protein
MLLISVPANVPAASAGALTINGIAKSNVRMVLQLHV